MFRYRNKRTGGVIVARQRVPYYDQLPRWELLNPPPADEQALRRPLEPPSKRANRDAWAEYWLAQGIDPDVVDGMSRAELVNHRAD